MWYLQNARTPDWSAAIAHLRDADPRVAAAIDAVGACTLSPRRDDFVLLCQSIFNQQISMRVATVLFGRFRDAFPRRKPTPAAVREALRAEPERFRAMGVSRQKHAYLIDLAEHFIDGRINPRRLRTMDDDEAVACLTSVKGVGRWTAEMLMMFGHNRPDVLPTGDLGLQDAVHRVYRTRERPKPARVEKIAEPWRPWRTVGTWYLWRYSPPGSDTKGD